MKLNLIRLLPLALSLAFAVSAQAADYTVDPSHSSVGFTVRHIVGNVKGEFKDFGGAFTFNANKVSEAAGNFTVKMSSLSTNNEKRDTHLQSPDFFDGGKFPEMTFSKVVVTPNGKGKYKMAGDLTLHGVTKPQAFDLVYNGAAKDPWGSMRAGFTATGKLNRKDYGIVWNKLLDNGSAMLGEDVTMELQIEAVEGKPADKKAAK